jgi:hypothetical protein
MDKKLIRQKVIEVDVALLKEQEKQLIIKNQRIKQLEDACLSKRKRDEYPGQNVIYLIIQPMTTLNVEHTSLVKRKI